jgi:hypothetical protein
MNFIPIILGIIVGLLTCIFIKNPKTFIEPYIVFGMAYFIVVITYVSLKIGHIKFITKHPVRFFIETLILGIFTYVFFYIVYHFRGLAVAKDHPYFVFFTLFAIIVNTLFELMGLYDR